MSSRPIFGPIGTCRLLSAVTPVLRRAKAIRPPRLHRCHCFLDVRPFGSPLSAQGSRRTSARGPPLFAKCHGHQGPRCNPPLSDPATGGLRPLPWAERGTLLFPECKQPVTYSICVLLRGSSGRSPLQLSIAWAAFTVLQRQPLQASLLQHLYVLAVFAGHREERIGKLKASILDIGGIIAEIASNLCPSSVERLPNCLCGLRSERRTINKPSSTHGRPQTQSSSSRYEPARSSSIRYLPDNLASSGCLH